MSPPAPFRDHDRWVAYNQHMMGAFVLGVFAAMLFVGGWWHMTSGLVVEEATTDAGEVGFAVVEVTDALFEGAVLFLAGVTLWKFAWGQYDAARTQREISKGRNMAAAMITTTIVAAVLDALTRQEVSE